MNFVSPKLQLFLSNHLPQCQLQAQQEREGDFSISRFSKVYRSTTLFFFRSSDILRLHVYFSVTILQSRSSIERAKFPARTISKVSPLRRQGQICLSVDRACFFFHIANAVDTRVIKWRVCYIPTVITNSFLLVNLWDFLRKFFQNVNSNFW